MIEVGTAEAAIILGVSQRTVARYVEQGILKPTRILPGGRGYIMLNRSKVERLAAKNKD